MITNEKRNTTVDITLLDEEIMKLDLNEFEWELLDDPDPMSEEVRANLIKKCPQDINPLILKRLAIGEDSLISKAAQAALNELPESTISVSWNEMDQDPIELDEDLGMSV